MSGALNPALLCAEALRPMAKRPKCVALVANNPQREPGWRQPWAKRSYRIFDYFISSCEGLRTIFLETYSFVRPEQILLWNTPVDIERSVRKAGEPTDKAGSTRASLIALGRLCEQKRFDVLLEAFALVRKKQQVDLLILGEGPLRQRLEQQAAAIGVYDSVYMPGFSANPYPALNEADVYIMSSDFEGLPNALLEAQALGVPVVTTDCPTGPSDIIAEGETGLLIECRDPKALAGEVLKLLEDHELRKKMKEAARKRVSEHFDVHVCMPKLEALLETIAALP